MLSFSLAMTGFWRNRPLLILCVDRGFRSRSDTIAGNRDHRERRGGVFRWPAGRGAVHDGTDLQKVGFVFLGRVMLSELKAV